MLVVSPTFGMQERVIIVPENSYDLLEVEVVLQPEEEGGADVELRVIDSSGDPVSDATVLLDGQDFGRLSTGGFMVFQDLKSGFRTIEVQAELMKQQGPTEFLLNEGTQEILVPMAWEPGATLITVRTGDALVGDATVRFLGPLPRAAAELGPNGRDLVVLQPGEWTLVVSSAEYGLQQRTVTIDKDSAGLHRVDIVLIPEAGGLAELDLAVVDPLGRPVSDAEVFLDGYSQGKTTLAGLKVGQRLAGERRLEVRASAYRPYVEMVELPEGSVSHKVHLNWSRGATLVEVSAGGEPVIDAVVRGVGPSILPPVPVDVDGKRLLALSPGDWQLIVTSADYGFSQANLTISEESEGLVEVPIELEAVEEGFGQALFRVRRPDGAPIDGAKVQLDGADKGVTADGNLLCDNLFPGMTKLVVEAENYLPISIGKLEVNPGSQEYIIVLEPLTYAVIVRVTQPDGQPADAEISFSGAVDMPPVRTGPTGEFQGWLPSGDWQIIASAEGLGPLRQKVAVTPSQDPYVVEMGLAASRIEARGKTVIPEKIRFATDSDRLTLASSPILDEVANFVISRPGIVRIEVQGHTDASGRIAYNQDLSRRRALAVLDALIQRGVAPERLLARGYGTQRPLVPGRTPEAYAKNRRVEFVIIEEYANPW